MRLACASTSLLVGLAGLATSVSAAASEIVRPRVPAVLVVLTPPGRALTAPLSSLIDAATSSLRWTTDLEILSPEQAGIDVASLSACGARRRMTCWARAVRRSFSQRPQRAPKWALIVVGQPVAAGRDRLNVLLLDVEAARRTYRAASRRDPDWRDAVEDRIFSDTPQSPARVVSTDKQDSLHLYFERIVDETLRERLMQAGRWWPSGEVEVRGAPPGLTVAIDGHAVAKTGSSVVSGVRSGLREVVVQGPGEHEVREAVEVPLGALAVVQWQPPPEGSHPARVATRWAGLGVVAAGAVIAGMGWARAQDVQTTCIVRSGAADCPSLGPVTFGFDSSRAPTTNPDDVNPGGVQMTSLGLAMMTSGAAWSAGGWWLGPDESPPWWAWLAGAAIGGATYAVAAAAQ